MRTDLIIVGGAELTFGVLAGAAGVALAVGATRRLLRLPKLATDSPAATALGIVYAATCVAMGLLMRQAVAGPFDALQLLHGNALTVPALVTVGGYGLAHFAVTLIAGFLCQIVGIFLFDHLTRGIDELEAIRRGQVGPALVLGAVIVVVAMLAAPGLEAIVQGMLPLPVLQGDAVRSFQ